LQKTHFHTLVPKQSLGTRSSTEHGSAGRDWFFANADAGVWDIVTDAQRNELVEDIG
jgi:hypothetical protein